MKKTKILLKMAALAVVGAMMSGCAEEIEVLQPANQRVVQKTTISLADDATTRGAIAADGKTSFSENDQIAIIYQDTNGKTMKAVSAKLTSTDLTDEGASATFTVELVSPKAGTKVRFIYPASMAAATIAEDTAPDAAATVSTAGLAKQDGTLEAIAKNLGLAVYDGTMSTTATLPTGTGVELKNQLAILKLSSIKDTGDNDITAKVNQLTVAVGTSTTYTVNRTPAAGPIYVAMLPVATAEDITISTTFGGFPYTKTATGKTLAKNKIYPVNLTMAQDFLATPLTFEAAVAGATVNFDINTNAVTNVVQYRTFSTASGWSDWATYTDNDPVTLTSIGDKVQFWGDNEKYGSYPESNIQFDKDCYAYGNIMSLINSTDFITETTLTGSYNFCKLFYNNTHLKSHADKQLMLPATTLTDHCYSNMFCGCTSLTIAPKLPAMEMKKFCYGNMFQNCTSLIAVPDLPATTLAEYCYFNMFQGCKELVTALKLPATTLAESCYNLMFDECSKLATVPADMLPATTLAEDCYLQMFLGCTSLTTAPDLPATTLAKNCYHGMFGICESLTTAPELRATTLAEGCYSGMFESCTSLATAPELRATTLAKDCYSSMFYDCTKLSSVTCLATNISADCLYGWLSEAGIEDGCGRVVYVDPSMLTVGTGNEPGKWNLDNSGEDFKLWTLAEVGRYPIALSSAKSIDLGRLVGADGKIYASASQISTAGTTAIGVIAYVDDATTTADDEITEKSHGGGHGLVLCLKNAASNVKWSTEQVSKFTGQTVTNADGLRRTTNVSGYTNTATLTADAATAAKYPAAAAAKNYTGLTAPTGTTGWFLPSAQQWVKIQTALGELDVNDITWSSWFDNEHTASDKWDAAFVKAGTGNYDSVARYNTANDYYWSSSENSANNAIRLVVDNSRGAESGFFWQGSSKDASDYNFVRPVLAF